MAMMAKGLEQQLGRCAPAPATTTRQSQPDFCTDESVYENVRSAYNALWDVIERNTEHLSNEVWSWNYENGVSRNGTTRGGGGEGGEGVFMFEPLGALPPPDGQSPTESDIRQLWSLTFLAVTRNDGLR